MVLEGKLDDFKCGCEKHYEGKKGGVVFCFVKENRLKWGGGGVLCFAKNGLRGSSLLHQGEWVGGWEMVLCFVKENRLGAGKVLCFVNENGLRRWGGGGGRWSSVSSRRMVSVMMDFLPCHWANTTPSVQPWACSTGAPSDHVWNSNTPILHSVAHLLGAGVSCLPISRKKKYTKLTRPLLDSTTFLAHHRCGGEGACISGCSRVNLRDPQDLYF